MGMERRLHELRQEASRAIAEGVTLLVLSDRGVNAELLPIPALLATSGVHHHLIREETRTRCGLIVETGDAREVHHFSLLTGYGAGAVNPYLAFETLRQMQREGYLPADKPIEKLEMNFVKAVGKGLLKVMSKMGISTQQSYRGAQIFEAIGLNKPFVDEYFTWTASRIGGVGVETIAEESLRWHELAWPTRHDVPRNLGLDVGGQYQWRRSGEAHMFKPGGRGQAAACDTDQQPRRLQEMLRTDRRPGAAVASRCAAFWSSSPPRRCRSTRSSPLRTNRQAVRNRGHVVRLDLEGGPRNPGHRHEPHRRQEQYGRGGEDPVRFVADANGDLRNSAIKQVASGRFGVTRRIPRQRKELQIKMAQGAKPGEGGQLPGHKVDKEIGRIRHSTPGVGLISPPPHHDIYSIRRPGPIDPRLEECEPPRARSASNWWPRWAWALVAAGVAKGKSDVVLISGHDGGTGSRQALTPRSSTAPASPGSWAWPKRHQVLVKNGLRSRIICGQFADGQLRTPRDIAIAALLGAEEWGIATAALVTVGCIMMRKCHLNTCPVGVATQDPELRAKFAGLSPSTWSTFSS